MRNSIVLGLLGVMIGACSGNDGGGTGTFPDFGSLALQATPNLATASLLVQESGGTQASLMTAGKSYFSPFAIAVPPSSSFSTTASDWTNALDRSNNILGTVLDGRSSAPITSMFALIRGAQGNMNQINTDYSDENGDPTNCTAIAADTTLTLPFWSSATNPAFNAWTDAGKYTCYATFTYSGATGYNIFGRSAIAAPSEGCTDAYEYYVINAYAGDDAPISGGDASNYGPSSDMMSVGRYYYNGCTGEMKINMAWHTLYAGGAGALFPDKYRFSGRSELTGNITEKTFQLRTAFIDDAATEGAGDSGNITTVLGSGKSRKKDAADSTAYFAIGYDKDGPCNLTGTCTDASAGSFCVSNAGTEDAFTQVTSTPATACSAYTTGYDAMNEIIWNDVPSSITVLTNTVFGLP